MRFRRLTPRPILAILGGLLMAPAVSAANLFGLVTTGEVFRSTDDGASWTVQGAVPVSDAVELAALPVVDVLVLLTETGTVYRSEDDGESWTATGSAGASDVADMLVRADGSVVAVTRSGTALLSEDEGATFAPVGSVTASDVVSLTRGGDGALYAVTATGTVSRSDDEGTTWAPVGSVAASDVRAIAAFAGGLVVMTSTGDLWEGTSDGSSWLLVDTLSQVHMVDLVSSSSGLAAVTREGEVATSSDGSSWSWVGTVNQVYVRALATDESPLGVPETAPGTVPVIALGAPFPNPAHGLATLRMPITLLEAGDVVLELYDATGRRIDRRTATGLDAGRQVVDWSPAATGAGVFWVRARPEVGRPAAARWVVLD